MKKLIAIAVSTMLLSGCGGKGDEVLTAYNTFVTAYNTADYETAYALTTASDNPFMTLEAFEESCYVLTTEYSTASKVKKGNLGYDFTVDGSVVTHQFTDNRIVIPELFTELELYTPTGSSCTYNGVTLTEDLITASDDLETVYTITNAPIGAGTLVIHTENFGSSERVVDPAIGDYNDFTLSETMTSTIGDIIVDEINKLNSDVETDTNKLRERITKYALEQTDVETLLSEITSNRNLKDPFTSYKNAKYTVESIAADFSTASEVSATVTFNVEWTVGEGKKATMQTTAGFIVTFVDGQWSLTSIKDWDFMILNALGGV